MSGLTEMQKRILYRGGPTMRDRMIQSKLESLQKAIDKSYQTNTAVFDSAKEFRCLINPSKVVISEDIKILSIPYQANELNDNQIEDTGVAVGQVITWKENGTHWLIYNQHLEELAYFRGDLRRCDYEIEINGKKYWGYFKGPQEKQIDWRETSKNYYNTMNESGLLYLSNSAELREYIKRFTILTIGGEPWEVQSVDTLTNPGIMTVTVKEWYKNSIEAAVQVELQESTSNDEETETEAAAVPRIVGETKVYPYEQYTYTVENCTGGLWSLNNQKARIVSYTDTSAVVEIITGKSGSVVLSYIAGNDVPYNVSLQISIQSL